MKEPIALLISGVCRSFEKNLWKQFEQLPDYYHIYMSFPASDKVDRFFNRKISIDKCIDNSHVKQIFIDSEETPTHLYKTSREYNIIQQWGRFKKLFSLVPTTYTTYVRCRPDLFLECSLDRFCSLIEQSCIVNTIYIPAGFDICEPSLLPPAIPIEHCINDQFAIGSYDVMNQYSRVYDSILSIDTTSSVFLSEHALYQHLQTSNITIIRIDLPYRLILSDCFSISICGDSGSGKSTVSALLQEILPFDNTLLFETDRYHKWERGSENYQVHTHLSPEANHLEKMANDAYKLSLGQTVVAVDYDHTTGKFTAPESIESKPYMILCGLHTLYKENLRSIMDLKIYIDTDEDLKRFWKISRDVGLRGKTHEQVLASMDARIPDYQTYILPQKAYADIIFRYKPVVPGVYTNTTLEVSIRTALVQDYTLTDRLRPFLQSVLQKEDMTVYEFKPAASSSELTATIRSSGYTVATLHDGYDGLIQLIILYIIWRT
jgi:uridine kinase